MTPPAFDTALQPSSGRASFRGIEAANLFGASARATVESRLSAERPRHFRYLLTRLRSREDAEDVLQSFTLRALQGADRVRDNKIDAWLNVSLRNALFDRYRREGARRRLNEAAAAEPQEIIEPDDSQEVAIKCLSGAIGELKPNYSIVLSRVDLEDTPLGVVAAELGLTTNNTTVRLHRARQTLRRLMKARCLACHAPCLLAAGFITGALSSDL